MTRVIKLGPIVATWWLVQRGDGWWISPAPGRTSIKGVPKAVPVNTLAHEALMGGVARIGGRFFSPWKNGNSFTHRWDRACERAGVRDLHFHDLRHTFATWFNRAGVDYVVIEKLTRPPAAGNRQSLSARLGYALTRGGQSIGALYTDTPRPANRGRNRSKWQEVAAKWQVGSGGLV